MIDKIIEIETTSFSKIALMVVSLSPQYPLIISRDSNDDRTDNSAQVVFFGTNDSVVPLHFQHVPLPRFKDNLRAIGLAAKEAGIPVVMVGPAPFSVNAWAAVRPEQADERSTQRHREYCDAVVEVGAELGVPVVGLWYEIMAEIGWRESEQTLESETKMKTSGLLEQYFWDGGFILLCLLLLLCFKISDYLDVELIMNVIIGLHFRGPAYEVEFKGILKAIQGRYQHLEAEKMQIQLPPYDGIPSLDFLKGEL